MWMAAFRDLQSRRRRFAIGIVATALVFAITLLLGGVSASLANETTRSVRAFRVDWWVVPTGVPGPFTSWKAIPASVAGQIASEPGVLAAAPIVIFRQTTPAPELKDLNVIGYQLGGLGAPEVASGRAVTRDGEIVVDASFGKRLGAVISLSGHAFSVVGITHGLTYAAGTPVSFVSIRDAQRLIYSGAPFATAVVTKGVPRQVPRGFVALTDSQSEKDLARQVRVAASTIHFLDVLLWAIAAGIIGAILYMSALERIQDFAVMKATGASNRFIMFGLACQAIALAVAAASIAVVLAILIKPLFPMAVDISVSACVLLFVIAILVGVLASIAGLRRAVSVDPALAFGA